MCRLVLGPPQKIISEKMCRLPSGIFGYITCNQLLSKQGKKCYLVITKMVKKPKIHTENLEPGQIVSDIIISETMTNVNEDILFLVERILSK